MNKKMDILEAYIEAQTGSFDIDFVPDAQDQLF
jgi:hypothetical protein